MMTPAMMKAAMLAKSRLLIPVHCGNHSEKRAMAKAAKSTIAPWAKLNTPEALNISTKPNATSEYSMPAIRPPSNVSRKNPMLLTPFALSLSKGSNRDGTGFDKLSPNGCLIVMFHGAHQWLVPR